MQKPGVIFSPVEKNLTYSQPDWGENFHEHRSVDLVRRAYGKATDSCSPNHVGYWRHRQNPRTLAYPYHLPSIRFSRLLNLFWRIVYLKTRAINLPSFSSDFTISFGLFQLRFSYFLSSFSFNIYSSFVYTFPLLRLITLCFLRIQNCVSSCLHKPDKWTRQQRSAQLSSRENILVLFNKVFCFVKTYFGGNWFCTRTEISDVHDVPNKMFISVSIKFYNSWTYITGAHTLTQSLEAMQWSVHK